MEAPAERPFDTAYEWRAVLLLGVGFSLAGLQRWILAPLFPAMLQDLRLGYQDLGNLVGILAICCGLFSIYMGALSDRVGRRRMVVAALLALAVLSVVTGVASGLPGVLLLCVLLGAAQGAYGPASVAATAEAARPARRGLDLGLQMSGFALFGFGLAPLIATRLLEITGSWRQVFALVSIPAALVALLLWRLLREPAHLAARARAPQARGRWSDVLRSRNVLLAMVSVVCAMCCIFVLGAMLPSYLIDFLKLTPMQMGFVMSALGFGGCVGGIVVPGVSDYIGRRFAAVGAFAGAAMALYWFSRLGADPSALFVLLFLTSLFCLGLLVLLTGPVAAEAVAPTQIAGAIGLVAGIGELFGGGVAPIIAGGVAQSRGIEHVFDVALTGLLAGAVVSALLRETAPRRVAAPGQVDYINTL